MTPVYSVLMSQRGEGCPVLGFCPVNFMFYFEK